ncbi:MAG: formate--tetrahydrofolate ligase [Gammaproteobacteria bacterium]|nr:formate--tetrahydrofolate ligase [Gammaproteobacteria bacterium]
MKDQEIARQVELQPISDIATKKLDIPVDAIHEFGRTKAKVAFDYVMSHREPSRGKLVLVTAMSPTPAGEGKTTTTIGLTDALNQIDVQASACLREPSLGPSFGMKGGAHGGGRAQVAPMEDINLHFTGDLHAVTSAHNLLASLIDNHLYWGNQRELDPERISWRRVVDLNDRALREINLRVRRRLTRNSGFDITAASEIMAVLCLSEDLSDLKRRLGSIVVGPSTSGEPIKAADLEATSALGALLKDAMAPNLVQTLEHNPVFVHGGPFANIAHGCNSVIATRLALAHSDFVVTEAGFGADLGAEKFLNIKCRQSGLKPDAIVIVSTVRSLKMHGGVEVDELGNEDAEAVRRGSPNLVRHIENIRKVGFEPVVVVNQFDADSEKELEAALDVIDGQGCVGVIGSQWRDGGEGGVDVAKAVVEGVKSAPSAPNWLYQNEDSLSSKIESVAREVYRADGVDYLNDSADELNRFESLGFGSLPICIAKTQYSFSGDPTLLGAPNGHRVSVREVLLKAGAGFVVVICGNIMTMPGLPRRPAAADFTLDDQGEIGGLF